jgi:hypothetical protein
MASFQRRPNCAALRPLPNGSSRKDRARLMEVPSLGTRSRNSGPHPGAGDRDQTSMNAATIRTDLSSRAMLPLRWAGLQSGTG